MSLKKIEKPIANFVWDFDGTLVESYSVINTVLMLLYKKYQLPLDLEHVTKYVIEESIGKLLENLSRNYRLPLFELQDFFKSEQESRDDLITLMFGARDILEYSTNRGIQHFIITHKGGTTEKVLQSLGISRYFSEVITADSGFERKPNPESLFYLINKYHMDQEKTFYIGD